ncbi:hypothetical protein ACH5RR_026662 [Cinchona calisaya]|uniref:Uncharacterized protein n=1 Tax=Cinchona calisaya TaxID=153742 RepID=A0ABD2Z6L9_9GENT
MGRTRWGSGFGRGNRFGDGCLAELEMGLDLGVALGDRGRDKEEGLGGSSGFGGGYRFSVRGLAKLDVRLDLGVENEAALADLIFILVVDEIRAGGSGRVFARGGGSEGFKDFGFSRER